MPEPVEGKARRFDKLSDRSANSLSSEFQSRRVTKSQSHRVAESMSPYVSCQLSVVSYQLSALVQSSEFRVRVQSQSSESEFRVQSSKKAEHCARLKSVLC